jgi:hypothetical protein
MVPIMLSFHIHLYMFDILKSTKLSGTCNSFYFIRCHFFFLLSLKNNWFLVLQDASAGLVAAAMIAIVPGYISRSVAGSYDNEGIAIFCMLLTYALWIKSVKTGSLFWSVLCALAYFYMVS